MASSYRQKLSKVAFRDTDTVYEHSREPASNMHTNSQMQWDNTATIKRRPASAPLASHSKSNSNEETLRYKSILKLPKEDNTMAGNMNTVKDTPKYKGILKAPVVKQTHASKLRMSIQRPQSATSRVHFNDNLEQRKSITFQNEKTIFTQPKAKPKASVNEESDTVKAIKVSSNKTIKKQITKCTTQSPTRPLPSIPKSKHNQKTSSIEELPSVETVEGLAKEDKDIKITSKQTNNITVNDTSENVNNKDTGNDSQIDPNQTKDRETGGRVQLPIMQKESIQIDRTENFPITEAKEQIQNTNQDKSSKVKLLPDTTADTQEGVTTHTEVAATTEDCETKQKEDSISALLTEVLSKIPTDHRALLLTPTPPPEPELPTLDIQYCDVHRDKLVVYYCKAHATVFCPACKSLKHADCKRIRTIKDVCKWVKGSKEVINIKQKLKILSGSVNKIMESRTKDQTQIKNGVSQCEQHISELRQECNTLFNRFETELYTLLDKVDIAESKKLTDHTSALKQMMGEMDETLRGIDEANKTKDQARIFIAMTKGKCLTNTTDKTIKDITDNSNHISMNFEPENKVREFLESVSKLGEIKISSVQHSKESMDLPHSIKDMKIVSHEKHAVHMDGDITTCWITGSTFLADGRLVICDHFNLSIKLLETDFTTKHQLELKSRPWDVAAMGKTAIVVTLPEEQKLQYVTVNTELVPSWTKRTRRMCWGIAVYWDRIIVTCHDYADGEVMILDKDGHFLAQIGFDAANTNLFTLPYYVAVSADGERMFITDQDSVTVTCLTMDGQVIYTFTNKEDRAAHKYSTKDIWLPEKLIVDEENNVLVCDYLTNTVIVLNEDGKKYRTLVTFDEDLKDGVKKFTSVSYRQDTQTLVLGLWNCDVIHTYKLTNWN